MISIIFNSVDQKILYSFACKNTDKFSQIEEKLYKEYPEYSKKKNYFISNGDVIDKNKTLEENKIKDNNIITLNIIEE